MAARKGKSVSKMSKGKDELPAGMGARPNKNLAGPVGMQFSKKPKRKGNVNK